MKYYSKYRKRYSKSISPRARVIITLAFIAGVFYIIGTLDQVLRLIVLLAIVLIVGGMYHE